MLKFKKGDNAIFMGLEAEGPYKGMPTLFVVGDPRITEPEFALSVLDKFMLYCRTQYLEKNQRWRNLDAQQFGLYFGAGSNLTLPHFEMLTNILKATAESVTTYDGVDWQRLAIETTQPPIDAVERILKEVHFPLRNVDWIIPVYWNQKKEEEHQLVVGIDYCIVRDVRLHLQRVHNVKMNFWVKVYIQDKLCLLSRWQDTYIAPSYDKNEGEYQTDVLLWKGHDNA